VLAGYIGVPAGAGITSWASGWRRRLPHRLADRRRSRRSGREEAAAEGEGEEHDAGDIALERTLMGVSSDALGGLLVARFI
jgi:hypothetical protein